MRIPEIVSPQKGSPLKKSSATKISVYKSGYIPYNSVVTQTYQSPVKNTQLSPSKSGIQCNLCGFSPNSQTIQEHIINSNQKNISGSPSQQFNNNLTQQNEPMVETQYITNPPPSFSQQVPQQISNSQVYQSTYNQNGLIDENVKKCICGKPLVQRTSMFYLPVRYKCNMCNDPIENIGYRCADCDYDLCTRCFPQLVDQVPHASSTKNLTVSSTLKSTLFQGPPSQSIFNSQHMAYTQLMGSQNGTQQQPVQQIFQSQTVYNTVQPSVSSYKQSKILQKQNEEYVSPNEIGDLPVRYDHECDVGISPSRQKPQGSPEKTIKHQIDLRQSKVSNLSEVEENLKLSSHQGGLEESAQIYKSTVIENQEEQQQE